MKAIFCLCILAALYLLGVGNVFRALDYADASLKKAYADYEASLPQQPKAQRVDH